MTQLSTMQRKIYDYIVTCVREQGYPPSVREIGEAVGLKSPSTVHFHLKHLEEAGVIRERRRQGPCHYTDDASYAARQGAGCG